MSRRHKANLRQLERYVEACQGFLDDLDDVLSDLRFQRDGGRLVLATDFSEIYSFALPGDGARDMVHFDPDRDAEVGLAIEASALDTIFFGRFGDVALLKPYHIELHNFMRQLEASQLERTAGHLLELLGEVQDLLERSETKSIVALHAKIRSGGRLSEDEVDEAIRYFDHHAPALVLFATRGPGEPGARLRHLLEEGRLARPESFDLFPNGPPEPDEDETRALFENLEKARRRPTSGANYLDAVALAQVAAINRGLDGKKARLLLISRSQTLAKTLDELGQEHVPLRHPRTWSAFFRPLGEDAAAAIDEVAERRNALALFIASAKQHLKTAKSKRDGTPRDVNFGTDVTERLIQRIEALVEEWLLGQRVLMSGHLDATGTGGKTSDDVARLLELVADDSRIFEEVRTRIEHLSRDHQYLGWILQSGSARSREIIDTRLVLEGFDEQTVFSPTTADSIQYTIQFSSTALRDALRRVDDRWLVRFDQLRSVLMEGLAEEDAYERLLAMAYTLGLLGRWQLAEKYGKAALEEAASEAGSPSAHEGHFFLAICARKHRRSRQRIDAGIARLQVAQSLKQEHLDGGGSEDPRYLKEEATLLQVERSLLRFHKDAESAEQRHRAVTRIETLLMRAIDGAQSDRYLLAQCYNGLCYLYLTEGERYRELMRKYRDLLEQALEDLLPDAGTWPANCIDTLCWAAFSESTLDTPAAHLKAWADQLETISQRPLLAREDRQRVQRHSRLIRKTLESRRAPESRQAH